MSLYRNALLSWQCVVARQLWYGRCVDEQYLVLKCHLLERFSHDVLFEAPDPAVIAEFLGLTPEELRGIDAYSSNMQQDELPVQE